MNKRNILIIVGVIIVAALAIGAAAFTGAFGEKEIVKIATTTSLEDTGLLTELENKFESQNPNIDVQFIAAGTGQAIEYGKKGDVDLVMVHSKKQEESFINESYGTNRTVFAYNYFYIVGPEDDPAKINGSNASEAFKKIMDAGKTDSAKVKFVSRGDNSGTNNREISIWNSTGVDYNASIRGQDWYIETGKGMGDTLNIANEKTAYTLSDSGTYLAYKGKIKLVPIITEGKDLLNIYSMIPINASKFPNIKINSAGANQWMEFVMGSEGQNIIKEYGVKEYGKELFIPLAGKEEPKA
ncbi:MAG: substrate-binding domain-containing protein [Methanobacteriaceae archaeon]